MSSPPPGRLVPAFGLPVPRIEVPGIPGRDGPPGPEGPEGQRGPAGPTGGAIVVPRPTPAASWAIPHSLGRIPSVSVYDASGSEMIADVTVSPEMVTIVFAQATAGTVVLT